MCVYVCLYTLWVLPCIWLIIVVSCQCFLCLSSRVNFLPREKQYKVSSLYRRIKQTKIKSTS